MMADDAFDYYRKHPEALREVLKGAKRPQQGKPGGQKGSVTQKMAPKGNRPRYDKALEDVKVKDDEKKAGAKARSYNWEKQKNPFFHARGSA